MLASSSVSKHRSCSMLSEIHSLPVVSNTFTLLNAKLLVLAIFIAGPLAYFFMNRWLSDFAYHIDIQWWMFAVAGFAAIAIAVMTVGFQSIRAALTNPVESLRSE